MKTHQPKGARLSRRTALLIGASAALSLASATAFAADDDYPNRAIRMIVPFTPGAATDVIGRLMAKSMSEKLGQPIVVENIGGAGAVIGAETAARAKPDGYTIMYSTANVHVINPAVYPKLPYDPLKSFTMIGQVVSAPIALAVLTTSPYKTAQEFIAYDKAHPGKLSYGSAGVGSSLHQAGEMFNNAAGTKILHVPYKGGGPAATDFQAGLVDSVFSYVGSVMPNTKAGKYRLLAVGSPKRLALLPDVPTVAEITGQPDFDSDTWTGLVGPAGMPAPVVERLHEAVVYAIEKNRDYLLTNGYTTIGNTPKQMTDVVQHQLQTLTPLLAKLMGQI
jgi:tripartite-type tricarboxylate transporter receptor subunit TctC